MQKHLLWLFFTAMLSFSGSAQVNSLPAKWTTDQKVVLESLPDIGQNVILPLRADLTKRSTIDLKATCEKMSDKLSTWKLSEDGSSFEITLGRETYPQWTLKDWEVYINRVLSAYLPNG
jgi:hypothetical protein